MIVNVYLTSRKIPVIFCQISVKLEFSQQFFEKYSDIKFMNIPSIGSRDGPCGRAGGRTDMTEQIIAFRKFANAPKNHPRCV